MAQGAIFCIRLRARDSEQAERALAFAFEAGAVGAEERDGGTVILVYAPSEAANAVAAALRRGAGKGAEVTAPEPVEDIDWTERWKDGLDAVEVSPRLRVRPSFVERALKTGQAELVIDPGQAFGTGGHASTRLALEWIDALALEGELGPATRILDVGTGSGVLALAGLVLGAGRAVGFDLDPVAVHSARAAAAANGLAEQLRVWAGPIQALRRVEFDLVVANLLRRELLPLVEEIAARLRAGGALVVSGLLAGEQGEVEAALAGAGLRPAGARRARDGGGDWVALLMRR
ncbi:MAG: 50S ribosomal protein L11 methyltransferase [Proteobacteria bacterium]|nr:50S ribosomal protein L11 methyltransferase [Pseudomonadota bacterium]